jgi:hypothetical protein
MHGCSSPDWFGRYLPHCSSKQDARRFVMKVDTFVLFLDIDGVLLRRRQASFLDAFELAPDCLEFLEWATTQFRCRWLSVRCRAGWPDGSRRAFRLAGADLDNPRWAVLDLIELAAWTVSKTEAIDPKSSFWWIDDDPTEHDRVWLCEHRCEYRNRTGDDGAD